MGYDGSLKFDTEINEKGFSSGISKIGSIAKKCMAVAAASVGGLAASFGAVTKASLDSVASLEQNIGGVETLFKKSADTVIKNANRAYETAGMSANEYMSTVTSFSASLLQSLGGDTKKAASYADRAIIDMSDNANKMGTSMELIQNAYQGFAKQNYTMLDNLKLGYGGTKEEMARLIQDASEMTDVQKKLGITVDDSSMSFGNIVNAISVMQESLGIAGTTSEEAATTIEGSMNAAKAAWDNFLNGSGTAEDFADAFKIAADNIVNNLGEIVPRLISTIPTVVESIYAYMSEQIDNKGPELANQSGKIIEHFIIGIEQNVPKILSASAEMIESLGGGIIESAPTITEHAGNLAKNLIAGLQESAPLMFSTAISVLDAFASGIGEQLPQLIPQALNMVVTLADAIISNIPTIVKAGIAILKGIAEGIVNSIPILISDGPRIINEFSNAVYSGLGKLVIAGLNIIKSLAKGIWDNKGLILKNAGAILLAIINVFSLLKMVSLGKSLIKSLGSGVKSAISNAINALKSVGERMINAFKNGIKWSDAGTFTITALKNGITAAGKALTRALKAIGANALKSFKNIDWKSVGKNIINGIINGVKAASGQLLSTLGNLAKSALKSAKSALGIHSPSKVFREQIGKQIVNGIIKGVEQMERSLSNTASKVSLSAVSAAKNAISKGKIEEAGNALIKSLISGIDSQSNKTYKQLKKSIEAQIKKVSNQKQYQKYKSDFSSLGKTLINSLNDGISKAASSIASNAQAKIEAISKSYQEAYDSVLSKRSSLSGKMTDIDNLYDLDTQLEQISRYQSGLKRLKGKIPDTLMDEILGMDIDEANIFTEYLNGLSQKEFDAYIRKWKEIQNTSDKYSKTFYADQLKSIKDNYSEQIKKVMDSAKKQMEDSGKQVAKGLIKGLQSETKNMSKAVKKLAVSMVQSFRKAFDIHSPSGVMNREVGVYLPPGIASGFKKALPKAQETITGSIEKTVQAVQNRISGLSYQAPSVAFAGSYSSPQVTVVNSQPVQLNAEIHTQVDLDGRKVGKGVTPYVNQYMNDKSKREGRGS